jgi:hypothetical protein
MAAARDTYPFPGLAGWAATLGVVVAYDTWAIRGARPTMSRTLGHYLAKPLLGPVLAGSVLGLGYHLLIEELMPAWWETARLDVSPHP